MDSIYKNAKMSYKPIIELLYSFEFIFNFSKGQAIQVRNDILLHQTACTFHDCTFVQGHEQQHFTFKRLTCTAHGNFN